MNSWGDFPRRPVQGAWVRSLVGVLRSCVPSSVAKKESWKWRVETTFMKGNKKLLKDRLGRLRAKDYRSTALLACSLVPLILMTAFIRVQEAYMLHTDWVNSPGIEWPWFLLLISLETLFAHRFPFFPKCCWINTSKILSISHTSICSLENVDLWLATAWGWLAVVWSVPPHVPLCGQGLSSGKAVSNSSSVVNENNQLSESPELQNPLGIFISVSQRILI